MSREVEKVEIRPGVGIFSLLPAMPYKPWYALGEFLDNSIQSFEEHRDELQKLYGGKYKLRIDVSVSTSGADSRIVIEDNAAGIYTKDVNRAFTPADPPLDKGGISQYGIGMKSAATWYSQFFVIKTKALGENFSRTVTFDIKKIIDNQINELDIEQEEADPNEHYTRIVLSKLNHGAPAGSTLGKVRSYLSSIYRDYLRSGEIELNVADKKLEYFNPPVLNEPFWEEKKNAPEEGAPKVTWKKEIRIELNESWSQESGIEKPPVVTGWAAILGEGSTKRAGFALLWKRKIVVGSGSMADSNDDIFKPEFIFGSSNTFASQRIFGELDLSELKVTAFKDKIVWRNGQEEEFLTKLKEQLNAPPKKMLSMAANYRVTERSRNIQDKVSATTTGVASALEADLNRQIQSGLSPFAMTENAQDQDISSDNLQSPTAVATINLPANIKKQVTFEVKDQPDDPKWLRIQKREHETEKWQIVVNRAHPFMNSFASLPGADIEPVLRIAVAIGWAEIRARLSGATEPSSLRGEINELLRGDLAGKTELQDSREELN